MPVRFGLRTQTLNREIPDDRRDDEAPASSREPTRAKVNGTMRKWCGTARAGQSKLIMSWSRRASPRKRRELVSFHLATQNVPRHAETLSNLGRTPALLNRPLKSRQGNQPLRTTTFRAVLDSFRESLGRIPCLTRRTPQNRSRIIRSFRAPFSPCWSVGLGGSGG